MAASKHRRKSTEEELFHFIEAFDGECPTAQDLCDDLDFDILTPPASPIFEIDDPEGPFRGDSESIQRSSNTDFATKCARDEAAASMLSEGSLEESCFAALLTTTVNDQVGEGQGDNFFAGPQKASKQSTTKKRKRDASIDIGDNDLDAATSRIEAEMKKLEEENKKLVTCFLSLGEQMQSMMAENDHLRGVLSNLNTSTEGKNTGSLLKSQTKSKRQSSKPATISPTVQLLAQVAMLSGAMKK